MLELQNHKSLNELLAEGRPADKPAQVAAHFMAKGEKNWKIPDLQAFQRKDNYFYINGLKARSSQPYYIRIQLQDPPKHEGFYQNWKGVLETTVEFDEFATSVASKQQDMVFEPVKI